MLLFNMYNPQKIYDLLSEHKLQQKELLRALGKNDKASLKQMCERDIRVSTLEKIADYFQVPVDTFFDRPNSVSISGNGHKVHHIYVGETSDVKHLENLLEEKDKRIQLLEEMVEILKGKASQNRD